MEGENKLKPCPFCGAPAHLWRWNYGVAIECSNYDPTAHQVQVEGKTEEEVVKAWNTRYKEDEE